MPADSSILLVDDNPAMIQVMGRILAGLGKLRFATSGEAALQQAQKLPPDLVLLDAEMPGMSGFQVCEAMKEDPALREIPVIFVTAHSGMEFELAGFDRGAVDFIAKPISEPLLAARVKTQLRVKQLTDELRRISTIDALTQLANRRCFNETLEREWRRGERDGHPMSLLMIDVDHFKLYNDYYGHPAGDVCLRSVAQALQQSSKRPADLVARYGGEEFAMLLPHTPRAGAEHVARTVLEAVAALALPHAASPTGAALSVSIGIGVYDEDCAAWVATSADRRQALSVRPPGASGFVNAAALLECADKALYHAKCAGRGRASRLDVTVLSETGEAPSAVEVAVAGRDAVVEREAA